MQKACVEFVIVENMSIGGEAMMQLSLFEDEQKYRSCDLLNMSQQIINQAIADYSPYAIVMMFSGGHDSLAAYHVAKILNVPMTHFMHGITGTGIADTTDFARHIAEQSGLTYLEANAGNAYEKYVLRKGFFGIRS